MHRFVHCATLGGGKLSVTYAKKKLHKTCKSYFCVHIKCLFSISVQHLIAVSEALLSSYIKFLSIAKQYN